MTKDAQLAARCRALKLVLLDVDGVMTDGTVLLHPDGSESKSFHVRDGLGIVLAQRAGLRVGILSGRESAVVDARGRELGLACVRQGVSDKGAGLREILGDQHVQASEVAYMGDDLNDLAVIGEVGLSAAPADAPFEVRAQAFMVTEARGGQGCVREFLEAVLRARGQWEELVAGLGARLP
jgi:3-deoxy-D-manno-octulosonate 8-phosphate phosphatase (KDO 8-P phosphatase)